MPVIPSDETGVSGSTAFWPQAGGVPIDGAMVMTKAIANAATPDLTEFFWQCIRDMYLLCDVFYDCRLFSPNVKA
ncbi:MAG TPA: hypothetical protein PLF23_18200 [Candidatus Obscuribacter sp.]|nr:hypothetical protein [Candidatus Obscuribacter sp.]